MNVLKAVLLPPGVFVLIFAFALLSRRNTGRVRAWVTTGAIVLFYLSTTPYVGGNLLRTLENDPVFDSRQQTDVGAIVVLAAGVQRYAPEYDGTTADSLTLERLRYTARLSRATALPVFVSGGIVRGRGVRLADIMATVLQEDFGVEVAGKDTDSTTTFENATFTAKLLRERGIRKVALVTHAWHMPRALASFRDAGVDVVPAPTGFTEPIGFAPVQLLPSMHAFSRTYYALHEWMGMGWYGLSKFR